MKIEDNNVIEITEELSSEFEISRYLENILKTLLSLKTLKDMICLLFPEFAILEIK